MKQACGIKGVGIAAMILTLIVGASAARAEDGPAERITAFYGVLLDAMKSGKSLGFNGRCKKLAPAVGDTLDLPVMTRFAVGPSWASLAPGDQAALVAAFTRMTVSSYAHNFDGFAGERFTVEPKVQERGPDRLVESHIVPAKGDPVALTYRMRQSGGAWKVIDVYYQGSVSELTTRRADFTATLSADGAKGLIAHLNKLADDLAK